VSPHERIPSISASRIDYAESRAAASLHGNELFVNGIVSSPCASSHLTLNTFESGDTILADISARTRSAPGACVVEIETYRFTAKVTVTKPVGKRLIVRYQGAVGSGSAGAVVLDTVLLE